jgi:hypothetical protein
MGIGVRWATDSAVNIVGGGKVTRAAGSVDLDFMLLAAQNRPAARSLFSTFAAEIRDNWVPQVEYTYPVFTTPSQVLFNPIMRVAIDIAVNIMNAPYPSDPFQITSAISIGFDAGLVLSSGGTCPAGNFMMTSYWSASDNVWAYGSVQEKLAATGDVVGETNCFNVSNDTPTNDEVDSLRSVGADFCTSYIGYNPPLTAVYDVTIITTPSTTQTTLLTTIWTTPTVYITTTLSTSSTTTTYVPPVSYVLASGRNLWQKVS